MQKIRMLVDEPGPAADPEVETEALARRPLASAVASTSREQAALDAADR
ncbi:MAG: hypothetical protein ACRYG8_25830 [Janthinobacterium lividum]